LLVLRNPIHQYHSKMPSIQCGQSTLLHLPKHLNSSKQASLTDTVITNKALKVELSALKEHGMLVYKVNKVSNMLK
jgi:hypothetical protein